MEPQKTLLIHGLFGSRADMWPVAKRLRGQGRRVVNFGYWSVGTNIEHVAGQFLKLIREQEADAGELGFNVVCHSMGSIVTRVALLEHFPANLKRVVMLAPPNSGSFVARRFAPFTKWFCPSMPQLSDRENSYVRSLGNPFVSAPCELGIVRSIKDRVIAQDCIWLNGCKQMVDVNVHHGVMPWTKTVCCLVDGFLTRGCFPAQQGVVDVVYPESALHVGQSVPE